MLRNGAIESYFTFNAEQGATPKPEAAAIEAAGLNDSAKSPLWAECGGTRRNINVLEERTAVVWHISIYWVMTQNGAKAFDYRLILHGNRTCPKPNPLKK